MTSAEGVVVDIPAGALSADVEITIGPSAMTAPTGVTPHSPILDFGPDGQTFAAPITITIPTDGADPMLIAAFFTAAGGGGFEAVIPTAADTSSVSFEVDHFSSGLIASLQLCAGEDACRDAACAGDADCTAGGVCSGKVSETEWRCIPLDGVCGGRCTPANCSPRGLCSSP